MATKKKKTAPAAPRTLAQYRDCYNELKEKYEKVQDGAYCSCCGKFKSKDKFYISTDPLRKSGVTPICKECAYKIAERVDENGDKHSITRESTIKALRYLDKPFLTNLYDTSIQEYENLKTGFGENYNMFKVYCKNVAMNQYAGLTFEDSDIFKQKIVFEDEKDDDYLKNKDVGTHEQYIRDKEDIIRLIGYDPFVSEPIDDQPLLYSQLIGMLDSDENANSDMLKISSIISIVRAFSQMSKMDNTITRLMSDSQNIVSNAGAIKSLQESKQKLQSMITNLAAESCISLKNSKNATKGENTWTGKIKKLKDLNLREAEVNGFDIGTCRGMQQVMDMSNASILKQLKLDESEYSDMLAEQREIIVKLRKEVDSQTEIARILLRENLDLKDLIKENNIDLDKDLVDLNDLYSPFKDTQEREEK